MIEPLQHLDSSTGTRQIGGRHQAVVPAADEDDIEGRRTGGSDIEGGAQFR